MPSSLPTLHDALDTFAVDAAGVDPRQTLRPSLHTLDDEQRELLERLVAEESSKRRVELGEVLGEGGMGVVRLAQQQSLRRPVAVKSLRSGMATPANALHLMREALITGRLEHPNIVPVHEVEVDELGQPALLLKRIEGRSWGSLLRDEEEVRRRFEVDDPLQWHLRVLVSVCDALRFAHSQGVVHRDLKPENVMIGSFGEVYVVDWGLAVALRGGLTAVAPAGQDRRVVGTPAYMAPEMLEGLADERTDVYLIGGILYELLTGRPPHGAEALEVLLARIRTSEPPPPHDAPEELASLALQALCRDPERRPSTVELFRRRLLDYLEHRGSLHIARDAQRRLQQLEALLARGECDRIEVHTLYSEARFGFQQALRAWPNNWRAASGLGDAVARMVRYELEHGDVAAAEHLLRDVADADPALVREVAEARRELDERELAFVAERRQLDPSVGANGRMLFAGGLAMAWTGIPLLAWSLGWDPVSTYRANYTVVVLLLVAYGVALVALRKVVLATRYNRTAAAFLFFAVFLVLPLLYGGQRLGLEPEEAVSLEYFLWGAFGVGGAITHSRWFALSSTTYLLAFLFLTGNPGHTFISMTVCNLMLALSVVLAWRRGSLGKATDE